MSCNIITKGKYVEIKIKLQNSINKFILDYAIKEKIITLPSLTTINLVLKLIIHGKRVTHRVRRVHYNRQVKQRAVNTANAAYLLQWIEKLLRIGVGLLIKVPVIHTQ